jgi:hypothetical protein
MSFIRMSVPCHSFACPSHVILGLVPRIYEHTALVDPRHKAKDDNNHRAKDDNNHKAKDRPALVRPMSFIRMSVPCHPWACPENL